MRAAGIPDAHSPATSAPALEPDSRAGARAASSSAAITPAWA